MTPYKGLMTLSSLQLSLIKPTPPQPNLSHGLKRPSSRKALQVVNADTLNKLTWGRISDAAYWEDNDWVSEGQGGSLGQVKVKAEARGSQ